VADEVKAQSCAAVGRWQGNLLPKADAGHRKRVESRGARQGSRHPLLWVPVFVFSGITIDKAFAEMIY